MTVSMIDTGERMVPEKTLAKVFWEHVYRYAFACQRVKGLVVLDIASGEGYGTYALSKVAGRVVGVDISQEAVDHAKVKYQLDYRVGDAERIPIESGTIDAVVSFETIEHVPNPVLFIKEISRVLKPRGIFILSTPNKDTYHHGQAPNPYHCSEMTLTELHDLLAESFQVEEVFGQIYPDGCGLDRLERSIRKVSYTLGVWTRWLMDKTVVRLLAPQIDPSDPVQRLHVVNSIPSLNRPLQWFWNPYRLERFSSSHPLQPTYFLTIARNRTAAAPPVMVPASGALE